MNSNSQENSPSPPPVSQTQSSIDDEIQDSIPVDASVSSDIENNEANAPPIFHQNEIPDPDDHDPDEFTIRFQEMLRSDPLPSWESFLSLLDKYISFVQKTVHVDTPAPSVIHKQDSPDNPKFIQSLYRRNRRRAVRNVIGENTTPCPLNPQELSAHFYPLNPADYDTSIYNNWSPASTPFDLEYFSPSEI